ncbi:MAG TPA: substrate-binding domain-containing protein [Usitatibacter sp.]|jgi:phosphate transport system substrate-binding protein|nr:substrate-binding domain-containing protein [Usitatibacter sp.]
MKALAVLALAALAFGASATPYQPHDTVKGEIRIWGSPEDGTLVKLWADGFTQRQPNAHVSAELHGPESTVASLYTDVGDIAFVGRELRLPVENMAFQWVKLYALTTVEVANAGLDAQRLAGNIAVFAHPANPIAGLTVEQLDGIFGAEHKRGTRNLRTWGDLGLTGEWADRPIEVKAPKVDSITAIFFRHAVLKGSFKWNASLTEFPTEAAAVAAVANDANAIAYARMANAREGVKTVPLAQRAGEPFVALTRQSAVDRTYPLARSVIVAIDRKPNQPLDPKVREFLRYVLSDEGQAAVAIEGSYLPLTAAEARRVSAKLDGGRTP